MKSNLSHIVIPQKPESMRFTTRNGGGRKKSLPLLDRVSHGTYLKARLEEAWQSAQLDQQNMVGYATRQGLYLEFKGHPGMPLLTKSLEDLRSKKIRLLNIRQEIIDSSEPSTLATVFVSNDKKKFFLKKIQDYLDKGEDNKPRNADLINSISDVYKALLVDSFWQDEKSLIPDEYAAWCEVWLNSNSTHVIERFDKLIKQKNIDVKQGVMIFPERAVKVVYVNRRQLEEITQSSDDIAEYRRAKELASFWTELPNAEQVEWVRDILGRVQIADNVNTSVCILDTGVNNGHRLLKSLLSDEYCLSVNNAWGSEDHSPQGHGTKMAGIVAYGDLIDVLSSSEKIHIRHFLESVKIIPPNHLPKTPPEHWGFITSQAISQIEILAPIRQRILCMAVSSYDTHDKGRPTSWSASIDQITSGANDDIRRLFITCAGNIDPMLYKSYPDAQGQESIHDPAQAWNAITVGAYTELDAIKSSSLRGFHVIAPKGGLSPFTTSSCSWDDKWPIKPDIVLEGGNLLSDESGFTTEHEDVSLLSTYHKSTESHFIHFNMTSAATAKAGWMAAQIQSHYPSFWPETIRGLLIHSAEWTPKLKEQFGGDTKRKTSIKKLMRMVGYGVPNLNRALYSANNSLTLISQSEIQPFIKNNSGCATNEMHLYELPWPKDVLLGMADDTSVEMRITLSYFIEPGPGEVGWQDRYRYPSHGLRFDVKAPGETVSQFTTRINKAVENEGNSEIKTKGISNYWLIGKARDKGSIHSDIWRGTAADLATSNVIAIFPSIGWWKERAHLNRYNTSTRYSLIVSITTPETNIDLYTPILTFIKTLVPLSTST